MFGSIPHNELSLKLWNVGIVGDLWEWFRAYLTTRIQCVAVSGEKSDFLPVISGVPQGNVLGTLLFLVYINDLPCSALHSSLLIFADDSKCLHEIRSPEVFQP